MRHFILTIILLPAVILGIDSACSSSSGAETPTTSTINVTTISPEIRQVTFANPPFNLIVPETLSSLDRAIKDLSTDQDVKVVIFASDVAGYFFNHFDMNEFPNFLSQVGERSKPLWVEMISSLSNAPFITIASIQGRTQGGGDELALAFDLRYASKERAVFGQPEVGIGIFPGGGATNHLASLVGRDRALEVLLSSNDYDAESAERYGWVTRAIPDAQLGGVVSEMAARLATFDKTALVATKRQINAAAFPNESERLDSYAKFVTSLSWPGFQQRMPIWAGLYQEFGPAEVEENLGYYIGEGNRRFSESTN